MVPYHPLVQRETSELSSGAITAKSRLYQSEASQISLWGRGVHTSLDGIYQGDVRFFSRVVGVLHVWEAFLKRGW